jgi:hypothetical protein
LAYGRSLVKIPLLAVLGFAFLALFFAASGEAQSDGPEVDPLLRERLAAVDGVTPVRAVLAYDERPSRAQVDKVRRIGVAVHAFDVLPMLGVQGTRDQIQELASLDGVASVYLDRPLDYLLHESRPLIGADRVESELGYTGEGVGVAVIDSGVDGAHPDVGFGDEMVQNVKILGDAFFTGATINALTAANDVTYIPPGYLPYYTTASGTSMATPHVSGAIALMEEADPGLTPDKAKKILVKTATEMPGYEEYEVGAGYLNAYKAVTRAAGRAAKKIKR